MNRLKSTRLQREIKHQLKFNDKTASFDQEKVELFRPYFTQVYDRRPKHMSEAF